ncbi:MAG: riboflavin synthase [Candidatus Cloacimonadota bacterium]|nr:MAG: riboflavin synthase [Candidatus Cloacimonadota bacterium]
MFTGIVEECGKIKRVEFRSGDRSFRIGCKKVLEGLKLGDSVAVNGICLTATKIGSDYFDADAMNETLLKTTAGKWKSGYEVHLERAVKAGGRLDGHIVQGHIDTTGVLISRHKISETSYFEFRPVGHYPELVIPQGSVAINGVSLTVSEITKSGFRVALIPHTLKLTVFDKLKISDSVNLEFDIIGKYVSRINNIKKKSKITEEYLIEKGF